jgi:hypothetical protein
VAYVNQPTVANTVNSRVNRTARQLKRDIGNYSRGESVTAVRGIWWVECSGTSFRGLSIASLADYTSFMMQFTVLADAMQFGRMYQQFGGTRRVRLQGGILKGGLRVREISEGRFE